MTCAFCDIVARKAKTAVITKSKYALAFMDKRPVIEGHCLVIPKKHYEALWELPEKELTDFIKLICKVQKLIYDNLNYEGADLRQHYRPFLPENEMTKRHVHFHVIPRTFNDEIFKKSLKHHEALRAKPALKELKKTAEKIKRKNNSKHAASTTTRRLLTS